MRSIHYSSCVNALSWAQDGNILLSGGDDTTIRIWRLDASNTAQEYPFMCNSVIRSGHSGNIFSVQMLPHSSRMWVAWTAAPIEKFIIYIEIVRQPLVTCRSAFLTWKQQVHWQVQFPIDLKPNTVWGSLASELYAATRIGLNVSSLKTALICFYPSRRQATKITQTDIISVPLTVKF